MLKSNPITRSLAVLGAFVFAMFMAINVFAQAGSTSINGTITDQNGAVVPGATVKVTNPATGFSRTVTTNADGAYVFASILPGSYNIEVEAAKFKKAVKRDVKASVDSTLAVNISLEPGEVSAVIDVTGGDIESVINTQDATVGNNFVAQQIQQLPTDSRNIPDLLSLQPGVTPQGYVAGGRSDQANITLDGIDVNDQQTGAAFSSILRITAESIEEFRITTTNANANQGRSSGAQISLITRGGTNKWRGVLFEFHRPDKFSANNFFNNADGVPRPNIKRNIFGGAVGGPIVKDKFFFFYSYEGYRERKSESVIRTVPLASLGRGELRFVGSPIGGSGGSGLITLNTAQLNAIFPLAQMNQAAIDVFAAAAARYPSNSDALGDGLNTGGFRFNAPTPVDQNTHIVRFDWNMSAKHQLSFRGNYQQDSALVAPYFPDTISPEFWSHPSGFGISHTWTISNNKVNNFRYGLTRQAFTSGGDSSENGITFRFVFQPKAFSNSLSRVTELQNFTDDFTWIKGSHTFQFGGNVRLINNKRESYASSYDFATANPSFYSSSGRVLSNPILALYNVDSGTTGIQNAMSALIGRFSQYTGNFNYDLSGNTLPVGTSIVRNFATEEYDMYFQDIWKPFRNLTVTGGLRYALSRPVYEKDGYQVVPDTPLGDVLDRRIASAAQGVADNSLINFILGGPKNDAPGFYKMDWNNWQPRVAAAWSPNFENKVLKMVFGGPNEATFRGGFSITNDYFGQQLAVTFDNLTTLGFTTSDTIAANTYNVTTRLAPPFTNFGQSIRNLPNISAPNRFSTPADEDQRIESSLDSTLVSPINYTWNLTYGRQLPKGMYIEATYTGRKARNLLATRDVLALNNLVDRQSGMDWYTAAGLLHDLRARNTPIENITPIPYFERLFPGLGGAYTGENFTSTQEVYALVARDWYDILDWTYIQLLIDDDPNGTGLWSNYFFHPQYAAFSAFSTVAKSDYHGGSLSFRQRLGSTLTYDINYTFSKSFDNASGLQTAGTYGSAFILNPLRPDDNYALSDFDIRHVMNANFIFEMPFGKGRKYFSGMNSVADAIFGGWQLSGIFRWNTGLPTQTPFDAAQWATNWNVQSNGVRNRPITSGAVRSTGNIFSDPVAAYQAFRNARPGETGDRNVLRDPGFTSMDMGLSKTFKMPWEGHKLQFRWEVFNVTNTQYFTTSNVTRGSLGLGQDPELNTPDPEFGRIYTDIQGQPRRMQFGIRYSF